jgi:hypothetical protein
MSLVVVSGGQKQVDRGADNTTSYVPNYHSEEYAFVYVLLAR